MPRLMKCPSCSDTVRVPDHLVDRQVRCAACGATFTATESGYREAASPVPRPRELSDEPRAPRRRSADDYDERQDWEEDVEAYRPRRLRKRYSRSAALSRVYGPGILLQIFGVLVCLSGLALIVFAIVECWRCAEGRATRTG